MQFRSKIYFPCFTKNLWVAWCNRKFANSAFFLSWTLSAPENCRLLHAWVQYWPMGTVKNILLPIPLKRTIAIMCSIMRHILCCCTSWFDFLPINFFLFLFNNIFSVFWKNANNNIFCFVGFHLICKYRRIK